MAGIPDGTGSPSQPLKPVLISGTVETQLFVYKFRFTQIHSTLAITHLNRSLRGPYSWYPGANSEAVGTQGHVQPGKLEGR